jgi:hypothetical protein
VVQYEIAIGLSKKPEAQPAAQADAQGAESNGNPGSGVSPYN